MILNSILGIISLALAIWVIYDVLAVQKSMSTGSENSSFSRALESSKEQIKR